MYPKSLQLLTSMAMRYSHDFGLLLESEKQILLNKMSDVYDLYNKGNSFEQINEKLKIEKFYLKQITEEIDGKGFFNPDRKY